MLLKFLDAKHPDYNADRLCRLRALYEGDECFRAVTRKFLPQNPFEPEDLYLQRVQIAHYENYFGAIIDFLGALMFESRPTLRPATEAGAKPSEPPEGFGDWREDCDGTGADLDDFLRARFCEALTFQVAYYAVEQPPAQGTPTDLATYRDLGLDKIRLRAIDVECIYDWEADDAGNLVWVLEHQCRRRRPTLGSARNVIEERWLHHTAVGTDIYSISYEEGNRPKEDADIPLVEQRDNRLGRLPIVELSVPKGLHLGGKLRSPQEAHFRTACALSWSLQRTAYPTPVLKLMPEDARKGMKDILGAGYGLTLGVEESMEWVGPSTGSYEALANEKATLKDELYRVSHQLALGVDNNAAAVGRSGESKLADAASSKTMLVAYAEILVESYQLAGKLWSAARGSDERWTVDGFQNFRLLDAATLLEIASSLQLTRVPSQTFKTEFLARLAEALLPDADQVTRDKVREEVRDGVKDMMLEDDLLRENLLKGGEDEEDEDEGPARKPPPRAA